MVRAGIAFLLPLTSHVLHVAGWGPGYDKVCPNDGEPVSLQSGYKIRYLCDDCPFDTTTSVRHGLTIDECAELCNKEDCKGTMWWKEKCYVSNLKYLGVNEGEPKPAAGCVWMTAQRYFDGKDDCSTCLKEKDECEEEKRQCQASLHNCEETCRSGDEECEKKRRQCGRDLWECEKDKNEAEDNERKCEKKLADVVKENDNLRDSLHECQKDLSECQKSCGSWGTVDGEIKCNSGSLTTATLNGHKWLTLCGFIINDVKKGETGMNLKECAEKCSQEDNCKAITYDKKRGECYRARKFKTGDMRYSDYYDTVLRLT